MCQIIGRKQEIAELKRAYESGRADIVMMRLVYLIALLSCCSDLFSGEYRCLSETASAFTRTDEPVKKVIGLMLEQLDKHHSFSYEEEMVSWMPGESEQDGKTLRRHTLEIVDRQEPYVGASYVMKGDGHGFFAYDGKKRVRDTEAPMVFEVDSLFRGITAYRVVTRPFFQVANTIGQYILSTSDSIHLEMHETAQEYLIKVSIFTDEQVEFTMGRLTPYIPEVPEAGLFFTPPHVYILHVDKGTYMPIRYHRILDHNSSMVQVSHVEYDTQRLEDFDIYSYLPPHFTFSKPEAKGVVKAKLRRGDLAPDFELRDTEGRTHTLSQYRGKTVLVEFTSVACSVCQIVPAFLHQLSVEFPQLQILSIEAWNMKASTCLNWVKRKGVTHPYLLDGKSTHAIYTDNAGVPSFFIIDAEGKIAAEFTGYSEQTSPSAIREEIAKYVQSSR